MGIPESIVMAAKCAPEKEILGYIHRAGLNAVELYLSRNILNTPIVDICKEFPLRYALHAPEDIFDPEGLATLAGQLGAETVIFHDIYWESEWDHIADVFSSRKASVCVENVGSIISTFRIMRRYGFRLCLDLEHLQIEIGGVFEDEFRRMMSKAGHVHMTGYRFGTDLWHTHMHQSPEHSKHLLELLSGTGYHGMVVSEARTDLQREEAFRGLSEFSRKVLPSL